MLVVSGQDLPSQSFLDQNSIPEDYLTQLDLNIALRNLVSNARKKGHLSASVDYQSTDSLQTKALFRMGPQYRWVKLRTTTEVDDWLFEIGIQPKTFQNRVLNPVQFEATASKLLKYAENHGYPFANLRLDSAAIDSARGITARLHIDRNRYFTFDSITISGTARLSSNFLHQYLGFKPGDAYSEKLARKIDSRLAKLPYVSVTANSKIYFVSNSVRVSVSLNHKKTDQIDGIVGFAPNSTSDNTLLITGEANIDLKNLLRRGIGYSLHWRSFAKQSQQLRMEGQLPYILRSTLGVDGVFDYVKFDTQFFTLKTGLGLKYLFEGTDYVKAYIENHQSALIEVDTSTIRQTKSLPSTNPVTSRSYGLQFVKQALDVPYNPRKGYQISLDGNVGTRTIQKDIRIEQVLFSDGADGFYTVYDSVELKTLQAQLSYDLAYFFPIGKKSTVVPLVSGRHLFADNIFANDLFRFGGTRTLRGFNEQSLQASSYTMFGLEYRYILGGNAFFQLFGNLAYIEDKSDPAVALKTDLPYGFGAGVHLEVNSGILTLAYALGSEQGNKIQFSQAKIHFGIINYL